MSYHSELEDYVASLDSSSTPITFQKFLQDKQDLIVRYTSLTDCLDLSDVWSKRLGSAASAAKVKIVKTKKKLDWGPISYAVLQKFATRKSDAPSNIDTTGDKSAPAMAAPEVAGSDIPVSSPSSNIKLSGNISSGHNSSSCTSKTDSCLITLEARANIEFKHTQFDSKKKWILSNGTCVEDTMFKYGQSLTHEHPAHSYILCLDDPCWRSVFTNEEFRELINEGCPSLPKIKPEVQEMLDSFGKAGGVDKNDKESGDEEKLDAAVLDNLIKASHRLGPFDQRSQYDQFWALAGINQLLSYYANNVISTMRNNYSELDLVAKYWSIQDRCFDDIGVITTRDRACTATSLRINEDCSVTGHSKVPNKKSSFRPDLLMIREGVEYGCSELGKAETPVPTRKEIVETGLHCPKIMKDIFDRAAALVDNDAATIRKLRVVCFHQTNRRMKASFLDCPSGYVCRVMQSEEHEIPIGIQLFSKQVIPIFKLTLQSKAIVGETARRLEAYQKHATEREGLKCMQPVKEDTISLPSVLAITTQNTIKKRKFSDSD